MKTQVVIAVDIKEEVQKWENWLQQNKPQVEISIDHGCGCCVHIYDISGKFEILNSLPKEIISRKIS